MGIFIWANSFENLRLILHCDNLAVCGILNKTSSGCQHCIVLMKRLMIKCLQKNIRVFAEHVETKKNGLSDSLSRLQFNRFLTLAKKSGKKMQVLPDQLSEELWLASKVWRDV